MVVLFLNTLMASSQCINVDLYATFCDDQNENNVCDAGEPAPSLVELYDDNGVFIAQLSPSPSSPQDFSYTGCLSGFYFEVTMRTCDPNPLDFNNELIAISTDKGIESCVVSSSRSNEFELPCRITGAKDVVQIVEGYTGILTGLACDKTPVEIRFFKSNVKYCSINLSWATASETINQGFEIQKSIDGYNWKAVGWVNGAGTTSETQYYSYNEVVNQKGQYYYRLKQVDEDGSYTYSTTKNLRVEDCYFADSSILQSNVIKHRVLNFTRLVLDYKIYDTTGRIVNLQESKNGIYFLKYTEDGMQYKAEKFLIMR